MGPNLKLQLAFKERLGIVADVAAIIAQHGLNIISMEVQVKGEHTFVYLETGKQSSQFDRGLFFASIKKVPKWIETKVIHYLPQDKRGKGYKFVLDSVSDGIISIDENGAVTTINRIAKGILGFEDADRVIGKNINDLSLPDTDLFDCMEHKTIKRTNKKVITDKGRFQFFSCCKPIKDSADRVVGAVEIMKNMKDIEELAHVASQHSQITFSDIIGKSPVIKEAISLSKKIADTDAIVSVRGESGTGKELFAKAIAFESRRTGPFVPINCAALPESLLESELFGYVGGAFTGASRQGKLGLFEVAKDGTVFLDEIADIPLSVQAKLLRLIEEGTVRRIGSTDEIPVQPRIITATNKNLEKMVESKQFREDLYYRINVLPIHIPPLRGRPDDLLPHFLFRLNLKLYRSVQLVNKMAMDKLHRHHWPGNVRELRNVIERAAIFTDSNQIDEDSILFSFESLKGPQLKILRRNGCNSLGTMLADYEKQLLQEALGKSQSIRKTARLLNISHTTLLNKIKKHDIHVVRK
jgi:transcriptional regulator of aroF, aroG, tyrA and aromatic amino acid transport